MTAKTNLRRARTTSDQDRASHSVLRTPRLIAFVATVVLAAATGLPIESVADMIPQADEWAGPFLGI